MNCEEGNIPSLKSEKEDVEGKNMTEKNEKKKEREVQCSITLPLSLGTNLFRSNSFPRFSGTHAQK